MIEDPVLLIADDDRLAGMIVEYLVKFGCKVVVAGTGDWRGRTGTADETTLMIPPWHAVPVIFLTARGGPKDRIRGLEPGADDYLPKPFEPRELLARLKSTIRRGPRNQSAPCSPSGGWRSISMRWRHGSMGSAAI